MAELGFFTILLREGNIVILHIFLKSVDHNSFIYTLQNGSLISRLSNYNDFNGINTSSVKVIIKQCSYILVII